MSKLYISVTADWEGWSTRPDNLTKFAGLRGELNDWGFKVPFTHFVTPAYWFRDDHSVADLTETNAIIDGDEIALHIHCWKSLMASAKVMPILDAPQLSELVDDNEDAPYSLGGHSVPLSAYPKGDILKVIADGKLLLETYFPNNPKITGFRAGAWAANDLVLQALMELGFAYDSSAVPPAIFSVGFDKGNAGNNKTTHGADSGRLGKFISDLWGYAPKDGIASNKLTLSSCRTGAITPQTQPYEIISGKLSIIEMPNNGGLSDYASQTFMETLIMDLASKAKVSETPLFLNIGCHMEGSKMDVPVDNNKGGNDDNKEDNNDKNSDEKTEKIDTRESLESAIAQNGNKFEEMVENGEVVFCTVSDALQVFRSIGQKDAAKVAPKENENDVDNNPGQIK